MPTPVKWCRLCFDSQANTAGHACAAWRFHGSATATSPPKNAARAAPEGPFVHRHRASAQSVSATPAGASASPLLVRKPAPVMAPAATASHDDSSSMDVTSSSMATATAPPRRQSVASPNW